MRTFAKLLTLFAAVGLAACTNDVTEDLATTPDFAGGGSVKTLSVALDGATRVALGEKTAEGMYPVEWQESDVLRINEGKTSTIAIGEDKSVANFTFAVADTTEYHVVYPYVEGLTAVNAACQPVEFATVQNYTEGSFDTASFPMYGHVAAEEGAPALSSASLDYLAGVLCLKAKGAGEVLTSITLSVTEGAIAGTFDVDCTSGDLTAHEDASKTMTYMLPEGGITLSETPAVFYIAIPAGDYKTMVAKLNTADVAMSLGVPCTGTKAIKAGAVREFAPVTFVANDTADHAGAIFEISDEASLLKFALLVADNNFTYDSAAVTASFEVSGTAAKAWGPIEGYAKLLEGNGNTITGLSAPLFGTTSATIQNLNMKGNYRLENTTLFGSVAERLAEGGTITNCTLAEGSTVTISSDLEEITVGGIVGEAYAPISNNTNYATFAIEGEHASTNLHVGGVVAKLYTSMENCDNHGAMSVNSTLSMLQLGGVAARLGEVVDKTFTSTSCDNTANITLSESTAVGTNMLVGGIVGVGEQLSHTIDTSSNTGAITSQASLGSKGNLYMIGGIIGYGKTHIFNSTNGVEGDTTKGAITVSGGSIAKLGGDQYGAVAGIIGYNSDNDATMIMRNLTNYAPISVSGLTNTSSKALAVAGVVGKVLAESGDTILSDLDNIVNHGAITIEYGSESGIYVGGAVGFAQSLITKIENFGNVTLTQTGNIGAVVLAGGLGYRNTRRPTNITNHGNVTFNGQPNYTTGNVRIAGVVAYSSYPFSNLHNMGEIKALDINAVGSVDVGGVAGDVPGGYTSHSDNFSNTGNVTVTGKNSGLDGDGDAQQVHVGGCVAYASVVMTGNNDLPEGYVTNSGNVTVDFDAYGSMRVGGVVGYSHCGLHGTVNTGNITVSGECSASVLVAGIDAYEYSCYNDNRTKDPNPVYYNNEAGIYNHLVYSCTNARNDGALLIKNLKALDGVTYIGGVAAYINYSGRWCKNNATVTVQDSELSEVRMGGVVGYSNKYTIDSVNEKAVTLKSSTCDKLCLGGFCGQYNYPCFNNVNNGNVLVDSDVTITGNKLISSTTVVSGAFIGGLNGASTQSHTSKKTYDNVNNGSVTVKAASAKNLGVGGIAGYIRHSAVSNTNNATGTITVTTACDSLFVGGVIGISARNDADGNLSNHNNGAITVSSVSNYDARIGGIFGSISGASKNMVNSGDITYSGSSAGKLDIGGVNGYNYSSRYGSSTTEYDHMNKAKITVSGSSKKRMSVGGCIGYYTPNIDFSALVNKGEVKITSEASCEEDIFVGGCIGHKTGSSGTSTGRMENLGSVYCAGTTDMDCYIGGCIGGTFANGKLYAIATATNSGRVRCDATAVDAYVGAIGGACQAPDNEGNTVTTSAELGSSINCSGTIYFTTMAQWGLSNNATFVPKSIVF